MQYGASHFMQFGERGATKDGKALTEEESAALNEEKSAALNEEKSAALNEEKSAALNEEKSAALNEEKSTALNEEESAALNEESSASNEEDSSLKISSSDESKSYVIKGDNLKKGWTSDDNSILKGTNVSVTSEIELLIITVKENRNVTFNFNSEWKSGDYEVVVVFPDKSETVLYDMNSDTKTETVTFKEGTNSIWLRCDSVFFKSIDLSIDGLEVLDF